MKKYKKVMVERTQLEKTICDGCGKVIKVDSPFEVFSAQLKMVEGTAYPEGTSLEETTIDMCPSCAEKAIQLLRDANFSTNFREVE